MCVAKEQLKRQLVDYMDHPYAREHIRSIQIADAYLEFICEILEQKKIPEAIGLKYGCAILLAHLALCIHDELDRKNFVQSEKQLMILMGAYYTSLYYELLCEVNDEDFIYRMAEGIANQSEARMAFAQSNFKDISTFLKQKAEIDFMIFAEVLAEFQLDEAYYAHYKYRFLELSVAKEFHELQSGQLNRPFYPEEFELMYQDRTKQVIQEAVNDFLETK